MKIGGVSSNYVNKFYGNNVRKASSVQKSPGSDKVKISEIGMKLSKIDSLKQEDRDKLVAELREKVQNGTYQVNSKDVAKKIMKYINKEGV